MRNDERWNFFQSLSLIHTQLRTVHNSPQPLLWLSADLGSLTWLWYLMLHLLQLMIKIWKCIVIHYVVRVITLMFVRYSYTEAGLVPEKIGLRLPMFPQVFYYPWAEDIMWLLGDALCSEHYYPDAVSMSSLTAHYDLLYTSTVLHRPSLYSMSHLCCVQAQ